MLVSKRSFYKNADIPNGATVTVVEALVVLVLKSQIRQYHLDTCPALLSPNLKLQNR
jgi:hypothetical protein